VDWNKVDNESYQNELTTQLEKCESSIINTDHIDETIENINRTINSAIKTVAPPRQLKGRRSKLKVMNEDIYKAIRAKNTS
jgi:hemolysin activation/secretion protein